MQPEHVLNSIIINCSWDVFNQYLVLIVDTVLLTRYCIILTLLYNINTGTVLFIVLVLFYFNFYRQVERIIYYM